MERSYVKSQDYYCVRTYASAVSITKRHFQIQFNCNRLNGFMFEVDNGRVSRVSPALGQKVFERDGTAKVNVDEGVQVVKADRQEVLPTARAAINPNGYV